MSNAAAKLESLIKTQFQKAKQLENDQKYEVAIQEYKTLIITTSQLISLQPNNKEKLMNDIAIYALKFISLEQKLPNNNISTLKTNLLNQIRDLAQNATKEENFQQSYENYLKSSNKLKALIEIETNPYNVETYRNKAKEYKTRGIKLRKLYHLQKIDDDDENEDLNDLKVELKTKEEFISDLVQKKSIISEENESLKSSISIKTSTINNLEDKINELEKKVDLLKQENIKLKENEQNEITKNSEMNKLIENLKKEKNITKNGNDNYEGKYKKLTFEYDSLKKNYYELNNNYINLIKKMKEKKN